MKRDRSSSGDRQRRSRENGPRDPDSSLPNRLEANFGVAGAIEETGELYRLILEHSLDVMSVVDLQGRLVYASPSVQRVLGYPPQDLTGVELATLVHPEDLETVASALQEGFSEGRTFRSAVRIRHREGHWVFMEGVGTAILDEGGEPRLLLTAARDVSERVRTERRLVAQHAVARILTGPDTLVEAIPKILQAVCETLDWQMGGVWVLDRASNVLRCMDVWQAGSMLAPEFERITRETAFAKGVGLPGRVWASGEPAWIPDVVHDANFPRAPFAASEGIHAGFAFPVVIGGEVVGVAEFFSTEIRQPDEALLETMGAVGSQIGQFIERARLHDLERQAREAAERGADRMARLQQVTGALSEALTPFEVAEVVVTQGVAALGATAANLAYLSEDGTELILEATRGYSEELVEPWRRIPVSADVPMAEAARTEGPVLLGSIEAMLARYPGLDPSLLSSQHGAWAAVPLIAAGKTLGVFGLTFDEPRRFGEQEVLFMLALAQQSAQALHRAGLYEAEERARAEAEAASQRVQFLSRASETLATSLDYETTLSNVARLAVPDLADWCVVDLVDEEGGLERKAAAHVDPTKSDLAREVGRRYPASDRDAPFGPARVIRTGKPELVPEITDEVVREFAVSDEDMSIYRELGLRSYVCVPLRARGRTIGAISLISGDSGRRYGQADLDLARELARRAAVRVDHAHLYRETQQAVRRMEESFALLDTLLASAPIGLAFYDLDLRYVRINEEMARINGVAREAHLGRRPTEVVAGNLGEVIEHTIRQVRDTGEPLLQHELSGEAAGTPGRHWLGSVYPVRTAGGPVLGVGAVVVDITERKQSEQQLSESSERLRLALEAGRLGTWRWHMATGEVSWDATLEAIFGLPPGGFAGTFEEYASRLHPDDRDRVLDTIRRSVETGSGHEFEHRVIWPGGSVHWVEGRGQIVRDTSGTVVGMVGVAADITERKRSEEKLHQRARQQEAVAGLGLRALSGIDLWSLLDEGARLVADTLEVELSAVLELQPEGDAFLLRAGVGWKDGAVGSATVPVGLESQAGYTLLSDGPVLVADLRKDTRFRGSPLLRQHDVASGVTVLIRGREGPLGVLGAHARHRRTFTQDDVFFLQAAANVLAAAIDQSRLEQTLRFQKTLLESQGEASIDGILVVSPEGRMVSFNRRFVEMWGIPDDVVASRSDEAALQSVSDKLVDPDEFLARVAYLYEHPEEESREEIELRDGRTFDRYSAAVRGREATNYGRVWFFRDVTESKRHEERLRFLAEAGEVLAASLNYRDTLLKVARLAVPLLADWCLVYILEDDGSIRRIAMEHVDPSQQAVATQIQAGFRLDPDAAEGVPKVLRTGMPELHPEASAELLSRDVDDPQGLSELTEQLSIRSWMCVPLKARGRTLGAISLVTTESGRRYGETDLAFAEELARRAALAVDNARLYEERARVAQTLQRSLLPPALPDVPGVDVAAAFRPMGEGTEVGGDFYDLFESGEGSWAAVIGDVCGKGIQAAALTGLVRHTIRATAIQQRRPSRILRMVNRAILEQSSEFTFCTVCYVRLEPSLEGLRLSITSGGHPSPFIIRAGGEVKRVETSGTLLGAFQDPELGEREEILKPGDALVLYTDGITEAHRPGALFGEEGLARVLKSCAGQEPNEIVKAIEREVMEFYPDRLRDDLAVLVLRARA
jgi:PAS domain S-box-containing protein